jgi:hypothetical protein
MDLGQGEARLVSRTAETRQALAQVTAGVMEKSKGPQTETRATL